MRILGLLILFAFVQAANAGQPSNCTGGLAFLIPKLEQKGLLQNPSGVMPDHNYAPDPKDTLEDSRFICIAKGDKKYTWFIHKHKNGVTVIIERYQFKTTKSTYYGPFQSAYKK